MAKTIVKVDEEELPVKKSLKPKKGRILSDPKPDGAARVILDSPVLSDRPVNVYKERVTDAESGKTDWYYWYTTEDSKTIGKDDIVKVNEKTQHETLIGNDFTILANQKTKEELISKAFSKTKFYLKDGNDRTEIKNPKADF